MTCVDEGIVIYVLIAKLAEGMTSCLMLQNSTRVVRICVCATRTDCYSRAVFPHLRYAAVFGSVGHNYYQRLVQVVLIYGRCIERIAEYLVIVGTQADTTGECCAETVVAYGVHRTYTTLVRHGKANVDVKVF